MESRRREDALRLTRTVLLGAIGVRFEGLIGHFLYDLKNPTLRTFVLVNRHNVLPSPGPLACETRANSGLSYSATRTTAPGCCAPPEQTENYGLFGSVRQERASFPGATKHYPISL